MPSFTPKTVLVTGAAGFIGSHLALAAKRAFQARVIGVDCFTCLYDQQIKKRNAELLVANGIEVIELDLAEDTLTKIPDADVVYHAAAEPGISNTSSLDDYVRNNIVATDRLLSWVKQRVAPELFVFLSTSSVYGLNATVDEDTAPCPASHYGVTKLAAEQLCLAEFRRSQLPACSCRLFSVYGPRERPEKLLPQLLKAAFDNSPLPLYKGSEQHRRSFTFIDDIIQGLLSVVSHRERAVGEIFNLGTPDICTTGEMIQAVESLTEKAITIETLPPREGDQMATAAVIEKARRLIGYSPSVRLENGIKQTIHWFANERATSLAAASA